MLSQEVLGTIGFYYPTLFQPLGAICELELALLKALLSPACGGSNATGLKGNRVCQGYARKSFFFDLGPTMVQQCLGEVTSVHQCLDQMLFSFGRNQMSIRPRT